VKEDKGGKKWRHLQRGSESEKRDPDKTIKGEGIPKKKEERQTQNGHACYLTPLLPPSFHQGIKRARASFLMGWVVGSIFP
jgi:hypothetical protein